MEILSRGMDKAKKESLELTEAAREKEWICPSFVSLLFQGKLAWNLIRPFPEQPKEDKEEGDKFLAKLEEFLKANLDPDKVDETREIPANVIKGLFEMGAFSVKIPKEYGGLGFSQTNYNRIVHLLGSYCGSTTALISAHQSIGVPQPLIVCGTEEQKRKYLPRFRQGAISGFALTESDSGSDPKMIKTTAVPDEDGKYYLLNGEKLWCTNGNIADIIVVMALTPPKIVRGKEKKQITAFIVETNTPGFSVVHRCKFLGLNAIQNGVIRFNNIKVPKENIILGEGEGLKLAFLTLNTGRLTLPAAVTGMSKWCLFVSRKWAKIRKQWGSPIGEHEAIASKLSSMAGTIYAMDAITWLTSSIADNKSCDIRLEAAMAKLFCTEESWKIVNNALQIRGGRGYETAPSLKARGEEGYAIERALRDSRVNTILEGSSEILHLFIAREALDFHLKRIGPVLDPRVPILKKITAVFSLLGYLPWYIKLWTPSFGYSHISFTKRTAKKLAKIMFHKMLINKQKLANKQNMLNRLVDIATDLFAISAVCSYTEKKGFPDLASLFCREARARIKKNFMEVRCNTDKLSNSIAKKILLGNYEWIENDIIKS